MGGGVIVGTLWGIFVSAMVLAAVSLSTPLPPRPDAVPEVMDTATAEIDQPETVLAAPSDPVPLPEGSGFNRVPPTEAASAPETDTPVAGDTDAEVSADAGEPAVPEFTSAPAPEASVAEPPVALAPAPSPALDLDLPQIRAEDSAAPEPAPAALPQQQASAAPTELDPDTPPARAPLPQIGRDAAPEEPASAPEAETASDTAPDVPADDFATADGSGLRPLVPFGTVTSADLTSDTAPETAPEAAPFALLDHGTPFARDDDRPLMSIVLIDTPDTAPPLDVLTGLVFPVAFAIDPTQPGAAERAAAFREAGFEVVIHGQLLPDGAQPTDVETALAAAMQVLPEAVAVLDTADSRIQGDRPLLDATVAALSETGHGLVAFPQGFNAAEQSATRVGLPAATLFRQLDDEDQRATVITRYLDRAEFAAAENQFVIVAGRTRPDTITALLSWALSSRSEAVAVAPLSAVLLESVR